MFKGKQKLTSILIACLTAIFALILGVVAMVSTPTITANAATETGTLNIYANKGSLSNDNATITWTNGNITFVNNKASSTTAIRTSDTDHYRVYKNSETTISTNDGSYIETIVITCTSNSYATVCKNSVGSTATASGSEVTVTPTTDVSEITFTATAQWRLNKIEVSYTVAGGCEHTNTTSKTTTEATCTEDGSKVVTCVDCGAVSTEVIPATGHQNMTTTTTDATCTEAGSTVVTCDDCGAEVSNTPIEALGHNIVGGTPVSNEDGTHSTTGACSRCGEGGSTVTEDCTYERAEDEPIYTCTACGHSYTVEEYTVTFVVPSGITAVESDIVEENTTTTLPNAGTKDGFTFAGWTTQEYTATTDKPGVVYEEGYELTVTGDITLYALYTYSEGTDAWTMVTDVNSLVAGNQIIIVASDYNYALSTKQNSNNRGRAAVTKDGDTVTFGSDTQIIALEAGTVGNTFAFNVGNGYLYAASSSSNYLRTQTTNDANSSWAIEIDSDGVATIKAQGSYTRNWLRHNNSSSIFACYASGQTDVSIYKKDGNTYYATSFGACEHANTYEDVTVASCEETGLRKVICSDCSAVIFEEEIPATGHNYVDNFCTVCLAQDPATIDYSGYYYIGLTNESLLYVNNTTWKNNHYTAEVFDTSVYNVNYLFRLEKVDTGIYKLYEGLGTNGAAGYDGDVTVEKVGDYFHFQNADGDYFSLNAQYNYVRFYSSDYPKDITLTKVEISATIDSASITLGSDITLNYYVTMSDTFADAIMRFTVEGETYDVTGTKVGERYVYSLDMPPQYMATNVTAELILGETVLGTVAEYSIKAYAQNQLNNSPSDELKQLLTDLLYYGAAAQNKQGYNIENLANAGVENIGTASTAKPDSTDFTLEKNNEITEYPAWFTGAGVYFDNTNKIYVKLSTTENVTLTINDVAVEVTGTTVYTGDIKATEFGTTYTFVLSCDGVVMQTLTYSVNAYAYAKQADAEWGELSLALYRYGQSAVAYQGSL